MDNLKHIEHSLEKLQKEFNKQMEALHSDINIKEFHNSLIQLSSKYPEHKELLQFVVFINDKLENNQYLLNEIIVEAFNDLIETKKSMVRELMEERKNKKRKINFTIQSITDLKLILIALAIIFGSVGLMMVDSDTLDAIATVIKIQGNN